MMTQEQHDKLKKYESFFHSAIHADYVRAMDSRFAEDFINACKEFSIYLNLTCGSCILRAAKTLGKLYYDFKPSEPPVSPETTVKPVDNKPIKQEKKKAQTAAKKKTK